MPRTQADRHPTRGADISVDAVVVGSGLAGLSAARAMATGGHGRVLIINGEDRLPYKRTQISKHLRAPYQRDDFALASVDELRGEQLDLLAGQCTAIDPATRTLTLSTGATVSWRAMVLATGATPYHLFPNASQVVRSAADGDRINQLAEKARSAAVIGGGVLGIEVADQLHQRGMTVAIFSRDSRLMQRELSPDRSDWLEAICRRRGIAPNLDTTVSQVTQEAGGITIHPAAATHLTELIVECAGSQPKRQLAEAAGLACRQGILVDETLATSHAGIFAAGDCVELWDGTLPHLWHQAEEQGHAAGSNAACYLDNQPRLPFQNRPRRLKCEAFGEFIFSMNHHLQAEMDDELVCHSGTIHQRFGFKRGKLAMIVMTGDKERAKRYEQALWAGLSRDDVEKTLAV
jgi:3-phenylpropionate/trans-cinnamate dioxygenase ferredoxin reductase subunit